MFVRPVLRLMWVIGCTLERPWLAWTCSVLACSQLLRWPQAPTAQAPEGLRHPRCCCTSLNLCPPCACPAPPAPQVAQLQKGADRLQQVFSKQITLFREAVYLLFGYRVEMATDPAARWVGGRG